MSSDPKAERYGQTGAIILITALMLLEMMFGVWLIINMGDFSWWQRVLVGWVFLRSSVWWFRTIAEALP